MKSTNEDVPRCVSPGHIVRSLENVVVLARLAVARWRIVLLRRLGASIGWKTRAGARLRVDRPWCLAVGGRCEFESDVWFKIVSDSARIEVGEGTFIGRGVEIDASHRVQIGSRVLLAPGVFITDHAHHCDAGDWIDVQGCWESPVVIEDGAWVGVRSVVMPGVRIGRGAIVGAGAVVTRDVPSNAIVAGVPARVLRLRDGTKPCHSGPRVGECKS